VISGVFEALADPTRRRLIQVLRTGERSVNDLVEQVAITQPGVSKQLRVLHEAGFVQVRPEGQRRLYSLRPEPFRELDAWMDDYRHLWESRFDRLASQLEARQRRREDATRPTEQSEQIRQTQQRANTAEKESDVQP
jgi:DNA-binding transcriptional ArsR family regulator